MKGYKVRRFTEIAVMAACVLTSLIVVCMMLLSILDAFAMGLTQ